MKPASVRFLLLLLLVACAQHVHCVSISRPFLITNPLPSTDNPCICTTPSDDFADPCQVRVELQAPDSPDLLFQGVLQNVGTDALKQCTCWAPVLTTNRTFSATLFCSDEPNSQVTLHINNIETEAWVCTATGSAAPVATLATCEALFVNAQIPSQAWVTTPRPRTLLVPPNAQFSDHVDAPQPLYEPLTASWTFSPMNARCPPFTVTARTPEKCLYRPREVTAQITENDATLNTLMWAVILALYTAFLASGSVTHSPVNTLIAMAAVQIGFISCAFSLSFTQFLFSHLVALALFLLFVIVPPCVRICAGQRSKLLIPDAAMIWGTCLGVVYLLVALTVLLLMLATNK